MIRFSSLLLAVVFSAFLPSCQVPMDGVVGQVRVTGNLDGLLQEARSAWVVMESKSARTLAGRAARQRYNLAVAAVVKSIAAREGSADWGKPVVLNGARRWSITFDAPSQNAVPTRLSLSEFSGCELAEEVVLSGFDEVDSEDGIGVPVVLEQDDASRVAQPFHPPDGEFLPATAVLEFPDNGKDEVSEVKLRFYNPMVVSVVSVAGTTRPITANLTAALQRSLTNAVADEQRPEVAESSAVAADDQVHLFFLNRYDPAKIPVVFVHGLMCGPAIWKNAVNSIFTDPELNRRYQPACFMYPSGMPIPTTSARLREMLRNARKSLDPGRENPGFDEIVLVGHSMGGLVSRMQVIDSGDDFWKAYFTVPPRSIRRRVDSGTRRMLTRSLFFEREPDVARVIFICTPHKGSELADVGFFRSVLRVVLFLPRTAKETLEGLADLPLAFVREDLRSFQDRGLTGTENLATSHPFFEALEKRPIRVPYHSIIATDGDFDFRNGSDRVVPYSSSHLPGAKSEIRVPYWHGCVERPETVKAVGEILKAH